MTKKEALKILEEVMSSIDSYAGLEAPDVAKMDDWIYDLGKVFEALYEGELEISDDG